MKSAKIRVKDIGFITGKASTTASVKNGSSGGLCRAVLLGFWVWLPAAYFDLLRNNLLPEATVSYQLYWKTSQAISITR